MAQKRHASKQQNPLVLLLLGLVFLSCAFGAAAWAVDNGRISLYAAAIIGVYMGVRFLVTGALALIRN